MTQNSRSKKIKICNICNEEYNSYYGIRGIGQKTCSRKCHITSTIGSKRTLETREKLSIGKRGSKNPQWKNGRSDFKINLRMSYKYRQWRSDVFTRDNFTCLLCGIKNEKGLGKTIELNVDHIKPMSDILNDNNIINLEDAYKCEELWNINNGRTLCVDCHRRTDTYGIKLVRRNKQFVVK